MNHSGTLMKRMFSSYLSYVAKEDQRGDVLCGEGKRSYWQDWGYMRASGFQTLFSQHLLLMMESHLLYAEWKRCEKNN